jgi:hypothetical protein
LLQSLQQLKTLPGNFADALFVRIGILVPNSIHHDPARKVKQTRPIKQFLFGWHPA